MVFGIPHVKNRPHMCLSCHILQLTTFAPETNPTQCAEEIYLKLLNETSDKINISTWSGTHESTPIVKVLQNLAIAAHKLSMEPKIGHMQDVHHLANSVIEVPC